MPDSIVITIIFWGEILVLLIEPNHSLNIVCSMQCQSTLAEHDFYTIIVIILL